MRASTWQYSTPNDYNGIESRISVDGFALFLSELSLELPGWLPGPDFQPSHSPLPQALMTGLPTMSRWGSPRPPP